MVMANLARSTRLETNSAQNWRSSHDIGDGRRKVEGWLPRYMKFPQAVYAERRLTARPLPMA
jgi:hypothetical protein